MWLHTVSLSSADSQGNHGLEFCVHQILTLGYNLYINTLPYICVECLNSIYFCMCKFAEFVYLFLEFFLIRSLSFSISKTMSSLRTVYFSLSDLDAFHFFSFSRISQLYWIEVARVVIIVLFLILEEKHNLVLLSMVFAVGLSYMI